MTIYLRGDVFAEEGNKTKGNQTNPRHWRKAVVKSFTEMNMTAPCKFLGPPQLRFQGWKLLWGVELGLLTVKH